MKLISYLLCMCFSFNLLAHPAQRMDMERLFDEYNYSMTVEWDQKDQAFYDQETNAFFARMSQQLVDGVSEKDIMSLIEKKMPGHSELKARMSVLVKNAKDSKELTQILKDNSKDLYAQGASWNGQVVSNVAFGIGAAAFLGFIIWWNVTHECIEYDYGMTCDAFPNGTDCHMNKMCTQYGKKD